MRSSFVLFAIFSALTFALPMGGEGANLVRKTAAIRAEEQGALELLESMQQPIATWRERMAALGDKSDLPADYKTTFEKLGIAVDQQIVTVKAEMAKEFTNRGRDAEPLYGLNNFKPKPGTPEYLVMQELAEGGQVHGDDIPLPTTLAELEDYRDQRLAYDSSVSQLDSEYDSDDFDGYGTDNELEGDRYKAEEDVILSKDEDVAQHWVVDSSAIREADNAGTPAIVEEANALLNSGKASSEQLVTAAIAEPLERLH